MDLDIRIDNPCIEKKDFCINCNSHFMKVRPSIKTAAISKRFIKDLKDEKIAESIVKNILDCSSLEFHELHKFEKNVNGNLLFRARKEKLHVVYSIDKQKRIVFLRVLKNFAQYKKFLENKKEIMNMIARTHTIG